MIEKYGVHCELENKLGLHQGLVNKVFGNKHGVVNVVVK